MITIVEYSPAYQAEMVDWINDFFGFHAVLAGAKPDEGLEEAEKTLQEWLSGSNDLNLILFDGTSAGFIRLQYRGEIVAWIEDIYVAPPFRKLGVATEAIRLAEEKVKGRPGYTAVCLDVVPRNAEAVRLYHKLGYTDVSLITLRKEFGESKRDKPLTLFDKSFNY